MRVLFHGPGAVAFRPRHSFPFTLGVQETTSTRIGDLRESYWLTGNRGNLIHAEAPAKIIQKDPRGSCYANIATLYAKFGDSFRERISRNFDVVVISMANFIRKSHDTGKLYEAMNQLGDDVKIVVLGSGLQGTPAFGELEMGTRNTISLMNERAAIFGLRGHETKNWLDSNGFDKGVVLGCPSLFAYPASILSMNYDEAVARGRNCRIMTAGHLTVPQLTGFGLNRRGKDFQRAFAKIPASYVFQDEFLGYKEITNLPGLFNEGTGEMDRKILKDFYKKRFGIDLSFERYFFFNEAGAWRQAALRHDIFIGDRFHGGVAALQAGVPAIFLKADNRVGELTDYFDLPNIEIEEFTRIGVEKTVRSLLTRDSLNRLKATYKKNYKKFAEVFANAGLQVGNDDMFEERV